MQPTQKSNQENINKLKDWQIEAFVFVLLVCCVNLDTTTRTTWNLSKIYVLCEMVGDIFGWQAVKDACPKATTYKFEVEFIEALKTNLRLIPKEYRQRLRDLCISILNKGGTSKDAEIEKIIEKELSL